MRPDPCPPETTARHRVMVIDAAPLWALGMSGLLGREPDLEVCGHIRGVRGLHEVERARPHLVALEIGACPRAGLRLIREIRSTFPDMRVVVISGYDPAFYAERALRAGASGFLAKTEPPGRVLDAIRTILRGDVYVGREPDMPVASA